MGHTRIERLILFELLSRHDWEAVGLSGIARKLDLNYLTAHRAVGRLERDGFVKVECQRGRQALITLRGPVGFDKPIDQTTRGSDSTFLENTKRKTQREDMNNMIHALRNALDPQPEYQRPELSQEEKEKLRKAATRLAAIRDDRVQLAYILAVCIENARLLKECNDHRAARGYAPLHVHDNSGDKDAG